jgi:hypothetical protein
MSTHQYGRRVMHDPRDAGYLRAAPRKASKRRKRLWTTNTHFLDQGQTSKCVGFSWSHWQSPVTGGRGLKHSLK